MINDQHTEPNPFSHAGRYGGEPHDPCGDPVYYSGPITRRFYAAAADKGRIDYAVWKRLMREWYGLTPLRGSGWVDRARCAHNLVGKKCQGLSSCPKTKACPVALKHLASNGGLWDHARAWRSVDGELVFTVEPWGNPFDHPEAYAALKRDLTELGIESCFEGRSPYGATYIMFMTPADNELGKRFARSRDTEILYRAPETHQGT